MFLLFVFDVFLSQSVEERCQYRINPENGGWTEIKREAWISSNVYGLSRAIQVSRVKWRPQGKKCGKPKRETQPPIFHSVISNVIHSVKMQQLSSGSCLPVL